MNIDIADIIKTLISSANYIDKLAGLVRPYIVKGNGITKIYPVSCELNEDACASAINDLIPDKKYRTLIYFEDLGSVMLERDGHGYTHWKSNLKLVCWINMNKFVNAGCSIAPLIIQNILSLIPIGEATYGNYINARIRVTGEDVKSSLIFSKYSYDEAQRQYLHYPYDYFALNIEVFYKVHKSCTTLIEITDGTDC